MYVSVALIFTALPLLAAAETQERQQSPLDSLKIQGQYYYDLLTSYFPSSIPSPNFIQPDTPSSETSSTSATGETRPPPKIDVFALDTWQQTLHSTPSTSTRNDQASTEEWFLLMTGGNKTCFGLCGQLESSFNDSALLFAHEPTHPNLAILNCDYQPVLCNSWAAGPPALYVFSVPTAAPTNDKTDLYIASLNTTTTTPETFVELWNTGSYKEKSPYEGYFHPTDGPLAKLGVAMPIGYVLWIFSMIPSWVFMIGVSFISRSMMQRKLSPPVPSAGTPRTTRVGASPGDAR